MYITDLLDGFLARKLNQVTELGKIIDPLSDKICVTVLVLILLYLNRIPLLYVVIVVLRDVLILVFGSYLKRKKKVTLMSNYPGKAAVFCIGLIILFSVINIGHNELLITLRSFLYYISVILIFYSSYLYFERFQKTLGEK
jgi:CDP-diacylglycerol--glycerol-3-phosphate 3-phosphatidyltransferase